MQNVNDFLVENLSMNNWQFAFIQYDFEIPDKTLIWFKTSVVGSELPRNIFIPTTGFYTLVVGVLPSDLFPVIGNFLDNDSILRLMKIVQPEQIKAVAQGDIKMDFKVIDVHPDWEDELDYGQSESLDGAYNG